jgi:hypothetical protein
MFMRFDSLGNHAFAVSDTSKIAEVTVGRAHCAITPTKGHTITPDERAGVEAFMQNHENCLRRCQGCSRLR